MFDKYINYNRITEDMIRNREDNLTALESLTEQYAELIAKDGVGAISYEKERVQVSLKNDAMVNNAIQKEAIKKKLDELNTECKLFEKAWKHLTMEERQVLEVFCSQDLKKQDAIDVICEQLHCERATAYRKKDAALGRFKKLLFA
ncbi:hypothetical protein [Anaerovorax sp. IOR16]|uniref:hypothetical protein n=1 Tax=Anaerovorax sp. IOR16 TaxID=2773458 RepID=UPI0019D15B51|nr:hypothetical protein [Anaerovorax sp. IOR16]